MKSPVLKLRRRDFERFILLSLGAGALNVPLASPAHAAPPAADPNGLFQAASNRFAVNFLKSVWRDQPGRNQFLSPYSIESALLMTMEGARGQTAAEMGATLAFPAALKSDSQSSPWQMAALRQDLQSIVKRFAPKDPAAEASVLKGLPKKRQRLAELNAAAATLQSKGKFSEAGKQSQLARQLAAEINQQSRAVDQYELLSANGLWIEQTYELRKEYLELMRQSYEAAIETADFRNRAEAERVKINGWVSDHTRQKITDIIPAKGIPEDTRLILANAIYFRGTWQHPFDAKQTQTRPFTGADNQSVPVPMMSMTSDGGRYAAFNADGTVFETPLRVSRDSNPNVGYPANGYQLLELGYNGDDLNMWIVLPTERMGLAKLIENLSSDQFESWETALQSREVSISLPRFKLDLSYDLRSNLEKLGMPAAFNPDKADFSGMSEESVFISKVIHQAFVEVNEKGTEAAAATVVMMAPTAAPAQMPFVPKFIADSPLPVHDPPSFLARDTLSRRSPTTIERARLSKPDASARGAEEFAITVYYCAG